MCGAAIDGACLHLSKRRIFSTGCHQGLCVDSDESGGHILVRQRQRYLALELIAIPSSL